MEKVTNEEMEELAGVLKNPKDKRGEGQVQANYDRVFRKVQIAIEEHGLVKPVLFDCDGIDRKSLVYFNTNQEVSVLCGPACISRADLVGHCNYIIIAHFWSSNCMQDTAKQALRHNRKLR